MSSTRPLRVLRAAGLAFVASFFNGCLVGAACTPQSQPNNIAWFYPFAPTGIINATLLILPIPLDLARQVVPSEWGILENAYRTLLPNFPPESYPLLVQGGIDHDIRLAAFNLGAPDFSRIGFQFPFVDLLGDGHTSFLWTPTQLINNEPGITGARNYSITVHPSIFSPECDAYANNVDGSSFLNASAIGSLFYISLEMKRLAVEEQIHNYPISLFQNITNQPQFGSGIICDRQVRLYNTSLTTALFPPVPVTATIWANIPPTPPQNGVSGLLGYQVTTSFAEFNWLDCKSLQGYQG